MNNFMEQAHNSAHQIVSILAHYVFQQVSTSVLQRRIARIKQSDKFNKDGYVYNMSEDDIHLAYDSARKVGQKWISKLNEAGEKELAVIVENTLKNGRFLETRNEQFAKEYVHHFSARQTVDKTHRKDKTNGTCSIQKACNDCTFSEKEERIKQSGSKVPFLTLSKLGGQFPNNQQIPQSFSTEAAMIGESEQWNPLPTLDENSLVRYSGLNHIPECTNLPGEKLKMYPQGQLFGRPLKTLEDYSDHFNSFVVLNRMQSTKKEINKLDSIGRNCCTLWPYDWNVVKNLSERNKIRLSGRKRSISEGEVDYEDSSITASISRKDLQQRDTEDLRAASSVSTMKWSLDDIKDTLSEDEKASLFDEMLHHSSDEKGSKHHKCIGALKVPGSFHLWEQISGGKWHKTKDKTSGNHGYVQKKRKKEHMKAKRHRFYPNTEIKKPRDLAKLPSKVSFTESSRSYFMEFDLGECMMTLPFGISCEGRNAVFRSLEIVLCENDQK